MAYKVKEIFYTLQGEGAQAGRPAVFCRFAGCNLWNGQEEDRASAPCWFCDTDFVGTNGDGGGTFRTATALVDAVSALWPKNVASTNGKTLSPFIVCTGGEPLLQLDEELVNELKQRGFEIAVETNGTIEAPPGIDWLTVSPKPNSTLLQRSGSELKLVYPHDVRPESVEDLDFEYFYLSPMTTTDPVQTAENAKAAIVYCRQNPKWRLTLQYHKFLGIP